MSVEIDHGSNREVGTADYLGELATKYSIDRIYYPGCSDDIVLEKHFERDEIVYLDLFEANLSGGRYIKGDYTKSPFGAGVFDAVFVQDLHLDSYESLEFVRVLKPGGILLFSNDDCMKGKGPDFGYFNGNWQLKWAEMPVRHRYFRPFEKISGVK